MNSKSIAFLMFSVGAVIGSLATWRYAMRKYEQIAREEIDSVKEIFAKKELSADADARAKAKLAINKPGVDEYAARLNKHGYANFLTASLNGHKNTSFVDEDVEKGKETPASNPYVIAPEDVGALDDYGIISLTYYADQLLADENDELVEDVEDVVGFESLGYFGKYEDDSVFVRNERLKCDYEILLDHRRYSDVSQRKPHRMED